MYSMFYSKTHNNNINNKNSVFNGGLPRKNLGNLWKTSTCRQLVAGATNTRVIIQQCVIVGKHRMQNEISEYNNIINA